MDDMNKKVNFVYRKGERIGRYEIVNTLDQARFKDRYLGQQIPLHIPVIIEVFRPPLIDALKQIFLDRAQILMKLKHPNILRLRDAGVRNRYPFLVIDSASYLTVRQVCLPGSIQRLAESLPDLKQIAAALQYAHNQQVLHGDIQPENVLLDGNNNVLLWGFTFEAVMQNQEHLNSQLAGMMPEAVAYTAPEQIRGKAEPASDQYSLAILIYELLCGTVPFTGSSIEVAHQQMHALPPSLRQRVPTISERVEGAIMKALAKDPGQRFSDIQTFINTLEQEQIAQSRAATEQRQPAPTQPAVMVVPPALPQAVMPKASPPPVAPAPVKGNPSPPRRRDDNTMTRRAFAVGLVGLAAVGGAGGWYLLQKRLAKPAPPAVGPNATPPATQTTVNNTKVLIFTGHLASVNALAWSPDGKLIASASDDTYVQIFDATSGRRKIIYSGHSEEVAAVAWSPDSKFIASGGQDTTVQAWSPDGNFVVSAGADQTVQISNGIDGTPRPPFFTGHVNGQLANPVLSVAWSPDGTSIASGDTAGNVYVWKTAGRKTFFIYRGHKGAVNALAWSPDGKTIASASADSTVQLWQPS